MATDRTAGSAVPLGRLIGLGYLVIFVCGAFAEFFARGGVIVPGDAAATTANLAAAAGPFRLGIASDVVMLFADAAVAVGLYLLLAPVSRGLSLLAAAFRLLHGAVSAASLVSLVTALLLVGAGGALADAGLAGVHVVAHARGYSLGLAFFGVHLVVLAWVLRGAAGVPRAIVPLLLISGAAYLLDGLREHRLGDVCRHAGVAGPRDGDR